MEGDYQFFEYFEEGIESPTLSVQNQFATLEDLLLYSEVEDLKLIDRMYYPARISSLDFLVNDEKNNKRI